MTQNCSPYSSLSLSTLFPHRFPVLFRYRYSSTSSSALAAAAAAAPLRIYPNTLLTPLRCTAIEEIVETSDAKQDFVEIGYICSVHGLQGEVWVKPSTDFPKLRFSTPGKRWLRQQILGRERIQEVDLIEGRGHPGQKGWIVKLNKIDTVEQAQLLIGSTILVTEEDKPELEEGDFYSRDLVGMRVILKDTGEPVGTVVNVFDSGASDLLQVMLNSSTSDSMESEAVASGPLVWVPFAEPIVPVVDMKKREMFITPPNGLLELNIRSDDRSKKERRALEWKERKKFQKRLIAAKKKLCEMEQQHVFHGFGYGEKAETKLLSDQILAVNSKLLQQALQNIKVPYKRFDVEEFVDANLVNYTSSLKISEDQGSNTSSGEKVNEISDLKDRGRLLLSEGNVAVVLYVNDGTGNQVMLDTMLNEFCSFLKIENRASVPLILICPAHEMESLQNRFTSQNHFDFDPLKVWFLEKQKLPVVGISMEDQNKHQILMKSPWEILQTPIGSGGVISLLSSENLVENLSKMGVEYIEVSSTTILEHLYRDVLIGLVSSCEANLGFQIFKDMNNCNEKFSMVFSIEFMKHLTKQVKELHFEAVPKLHTHVEKVEKEWVDVVPSSPNSHELRCSIYSSLSVCPPDKICLLELSE